MRDWKRSTTGSVHLRRRCFVYGLGLIIFHLGAILSHAQTTSFAPAQKFPTALEPDSVATGDFNQDGDTDLAVTGSASNAVSVLFGDGGGAFAIRVDIPVGTSPRSIATADFNGDGVVDLAVANLFSASVSILLGDGAGFPSRADFPVSGGSPWGLVVGDFNGDALLDLAVSNFGHGSVSVLQGDGAGDFGAAMTFGVGSTPFRLATGDLNGDGRLDLVVPNFSTLSVSILLNTGGGLFAGAVDFALPGPPRALALGDYNRDGRLDVAVASGNPAPAQVSVLLGDGAGSLGTPTNFPVGDGPDGVSAGDLNGDGDLDLVVANGDDPCACVTVLEGTGSGTFTPAVPLVAGSSPTTIAIDDLNGDGQVDLAVPNSNNHDISIFLNLADPAAANLTVVNSVFPVTGLSPAGKITYTAVVTNRGPANATGVALTDVLPPGINLRYVTAQSTQGGCVQADGTVVCTLGTVLKGGSATVMIEVHPIDTGLKTNRVTVAGNEPDPDQANNSASVSSANVEVALSDLTVTQTDSSDPVLAGTSLRYTVTVTNLQDDCAANVMVTDAPPSNVTLVSITPSQGICTALTCNFGTLCPAQHASATITILPRSAGVITNTATVPDRPADPAANNVSVESTIVSNAVVSVHATDSAASELGREPATFSISRAGGTSTDLVVSFALLGTATAGTDYELDTPTRVAATIPRGQVSVAVILSPREDSLQEGAETVTLSLIPAAQYDVGMASSATVTIADRSLLPIVSIAASDAVAAELGQEPGVLTITRVGPTTTDLTVSLSRTGTAVHAQDYDLLPPVETSATIRAGQASATFIVSPRVDDVRLEEAETVVITLIDGANYDVGVEGAATVTIVDRDSAVVSVTASDPNAAELGRDPGLFTISRTGDISQDLTISLFRLGTATTGDYDLFPAIETEVIIPPNRTSVTVNVVPRDDLDIESAETVVLMLIDGTDYELAHASATVTIANHPLVPVVTVAASDSQAGELRTNPVGDLGVFSIARLGGDLARDDLTVLFAITGTATAGTDYTLTRVKDVVIPRGQLTAAVTVTPRDDTLLEGLETVILTLLDDREYDIGTQGEATITIVDRSAPPVVSIEATDPHAAEPRRNSGTDLGTFTFTRTGNTASNVVVSFRRAGTATAFTDYDMGARDRSVVSVTIPRGQASTTLTVIPREDQVVEEDETVVLLLVDGSDYDIGAAASATVTIADLLLVPVITIAATTPEATERLRATGGVFTITSTGTGRLRNDLRVSVLRTGTATAGRDYDLPRNITGDVVVVSARTSSQTVTIVPTDDRLNEGPETVTLTLIEGPDYEIEGERSATVTIVDNDSFVPEVSITAAPSEISEFGQRGGTITIARTGNSEKELTVSFLRTGTATYLQDYDLGGVTGESVTIPARRSSVAVRVTSRNDRTVEGDETVILTLLGGAEYFLGAQSSATITILDDDGQQQPR
jgi:uncharacterized repeat protein (TIGR01451 family)